MRLLSVISKAFEERRYRHSYLKRMYESLNDYSERTRTDAVYHTPPVIEQQWESQKNQSEGLKEHDMSSVTRGKSISIS